MSDEIKELCRKISSMEHHIINLIIPLQEMRKIESLLSKPLRVDDRLLTNLISQFRDSVINLIVIIKNTDFGILSESLTILSQATNGLNQTLGEIKFIGKRLDEIEKTLAEIKKDGIKRNINLEIAYDGYKMVKNPHDAKERDLPKDPDERIMALLALLTRSEKITVVHRHGLLGKDFKTFGKLGIILNVSKEKASHIYKSAIRKLKAPRAAFLVDDLDEDDFKAFLKHP